MSESANLSSLFVEQNGTIHGVERIATAIGRSRKALWAVIFLASLAMMGYECQKIVREYFTEPVAVNLGEGVVRHAPSFLVCPSVWVDKAKLETIDYDPLEIYRFWISHDIDIDPEEAALIDPSIHHFRFWLIDERLREVLQTDTKSHEEIIRVLAMKYGSAKEFLLDIMKEPHKVIIGNNTVLQRATINGGCYLLPSDDKELSQFEAPHFFRDIFIINSEPAFGRVKRSTERLYVGDMATTTHPVGPIDIPSGSDVIVHLSVRFVRQVNTRKKPCANWKAEEFTECFLACVNRDVCKTCKMMDMDTASTFASRCSIHSLLRDLKHCIFDYFRPSGKMAVDACHTKCPFQCISTRFESTVVPTVGITAESDRGNVTGVRVRFHNPMMSQILEETRVYSWDTLVCNLGGMVSLFCGASIISLVQLIVFVAGAATRATETNTSRK